MEHFFGLRETEQFDEEEAIDDFEVQKQDIDYLYQIIKDYHSSNVLEDNIDPQHKSLLPRLRKYQKEAVIWMVNREKMETDSKPNIHPLYTEVKSKDGKVLYYNRKGGFLVKDFPVEIQLPSGGKDYFLFKIRSKFQVTHIQFFRNSCRRNGSWKNRRSALMHVV